MCGLKSRIDEMIATVPLLQRQARRRSGKPLTRSRARAQTTFAVRANRPAPRALKVLLKHAGRVHGLAASTLGAKSKRKTSDRRRRRRTEGKQTRHKRNYRNGHIKICRHGIHRFG